MKDYREFLVAREFVLVKHDLEKYTDEQLVFHINTYLNYIMNNYRMDELCESVQVGCAKLAEWIDIHLEKNQELVKYYFPQFASEEGKAKLLTSKAVAVISKNLRKQKEENLRLKKELEELRICMQSKIEDTNELRCDDIFFTLEELLDYGGDKEDFARMVGNAGEEFAYRLLIAALIDQDQTMVELYPQLNPITQRMQELLRQEGNTIEVVRLDTESFKQPGYDIVVNIKDSEEIIIEQQFFEVKTHTIHSRCRDQIQLSEEQMKYALKKAQAYHVMAISYDSGTRQCSLEKIFNHIAKMIEEGSWKHLDRGYTYKV